MSDFLVKCDEELHKARLIPWIIVALVLGAGMVMAIVITGKMARGC